MSKLRDYLGQKDFEEYLRAQNLTDEDDLREKLIQRDFEKKTVPRDTGYTMQEIFFSFLLLASLFFKFLLCELGN